MSEARRYSNVLVKVGVERGYLLSNNRLKALTECGSLVEFASELQETIYAEKLKTVQPPSSKRFERAFRESLIEVSCKIVQNCPGNASPFLEIFPLRFELENIKAVLRAVRSGVPYEELLSKIYLGVEEYLKRRTFFEEASKAVDVKSVVEALKDTSYGQLLRDGLREYEKTDSMKFFDILLDKMFYERLEKAFKELPKREQRYVFFYVSFESDSFTLLTILRAKILNYDSEFIRAALPNKFYKVSRQTVEDLIIADGFEGTFNIVKQSYFQNFFSRAETPEETVSAAYRALRGAVLEHMRKKRIGDVFNIGTPLGLIVEKEVEVNNLTAISLGIEDSLNSDDIWSLLIV